MIIIVTKIRLKIFKKEVIKLYVRQMATVFPLGKKINLLEEILNTSIVMNKV